MNLEQMSIEELTALIHSIQERIQSLHEQRQQDEVDLRTQILDAISTLEALRGPDSPSRPSMEDLIAGNVSITEVSTFTREELQSEAGLAIQLLLGGLKIVTETVAAMARVQSGMLD